MKHDREVDSDKLLIVEEYANSKVELIDYVKKMGFNIVGNTMSCPFHGSDSTPSLKVNGNKWKCFGCGRGGGYLKFRVEIAQLDNHKVHYYDVVEEFVRENIELASEIGGSIFKTKEESFDEQWERMMDVATNTTYKPKRVEVKSYAQLLREVKRCDVDTQLQLLAGIQDDLPYPVLKSIVDGSDIAGMSLEDLAG